MRVGGLSLEFSGYGDVTVGSVLIHDDVLSSGRKMKDKVKDQRRDQERWRVSLVQ